MAEILIVSHNKRKLNTLTGNSPLQVKRKLCKEIGWKYLKISCFSVGASKFVSVTLGYRKTRQKSLISLIRETSKYTPNQ